jgi:transposase
MRHILHYTFIVGVTNMPKAGPKHDRLRQQGTLNPEPKRVKSPLFQSGDFFDPNDLLQTKYEMLRCVRIDGTSKAEAAALFGVSRPTLYQAEAAFAHEGLAGLLPKQRGPKGAHKLTNEVMTFVEQRLQDDGSIHARALVKEIKSTLGLSVHPRSIERAVVRKKKP